MGIFKKIANALKKTRESVARKIDSLLSHGELDDDFFDDLTDILISCDIGVRTSMDLVDELRVRARKNKIRTGEGVREELKNILKEDFASLNQIEIEYPAIITIIGVNGVGKTTTIGKMAKYFKNNGEVSRYILDNSDIGNTIFLKASRVMKFEEIIENLKRGKL